jgi:hypothetical protein
VIETRPGAEIYTPYVSASASATTLGMTDDEKRDVRRRPIGFAPPLAKRPAAKPRIRPKLAR